jgi:opacity protein-like surface antigen
MSRKMTVLIGVALAVAGTGSTAWADSIDAVAPLGLYLGGSIGRANVRVDSQTTGSLFDFDEHATGWKAMLGIRPISAFGVELEYIDFGDPETSANGVSRDARARAGGLFAVGYLPIPVVDVFGKAGIARLQSITKGSFATLQPTGQVCQNSSLSCLVENDHTDNRFAYGGGVQVKLARLGIRAEYERISASGGDPSLLSVGAIYTF